jgi:hypothetical protein
VPQTALPVSPDDYNDGWTPTVVYSQVDQPVPTDTKFVTSTPGEVGDSFGVKLARLAWSQESPQTLTVRLRCTDATEVLVSFALLQGTNFIAGTNVQPTESFTNYSLTLSTEEMAAITDYTDLHVQVTVGNPIECDICPDNPLPVVLHATFTDKTGAFTCLPDSVSLYYVEEENQWFSTNATYCWEGCSPFIGNLVQLLCGDTGEWVLVVFSCTWLP